MSATTPGEGTHGSAEDLTARSLDERLDALEGLVDELGATVLDLVGEGQDGYNDDRPEISHGDAGGDAGDAPGKDDTAPTGWATRASAEDWHDLAAWVDWLGATYDHQPSRAVLPCWPAHGGTVHELAALRTAWIAAAITDSSDEPGDAMAAWHEGLLRPCLVRLREDYAIKACADRHVTPRPRPQTDHDLLMAASRSATAVGAGSSRDDTYDQSAGELR